MLNPQELMCHNKNESFVITLPFCHFHCVTNKRLKAPIRPFFTADVLTGHSRKSSGVADLRISDHDSMPVSQRDQTQDPSMELKHH